MSALKAIEVSDSLLPQDHGIEADHTLVRVKACLTHRFPGKDVTRAGAAVGTLQNMTTVRAALQHPEAMRKLPKALAGIGLRYTAVPSENWEAVRAKAVEAIGVLREELRALAGKP